MITRSHLLRLAASRSRRMSRRPRVGAGHDQDRRAQQLQGACPPSSSPTRRAGSWRSRRSTPRAACSAGRSRSISRDDNGNPGDAVRVAEELVSREDVVDPDRHLPVATSASRSPTSPSSDKVLFLAAEPLTDKIVWENGNRYTFRLRPSTYMQTAMLVPEAVKLKKKRWAIVYPNYEYGQSATATFKKLLKEAAARRRVRRRAGAAARQDRCRRGGPGAGRCQARRDLQRRCSAPTSRSSCARATRAACFKGRRSSAC